MPTKRRLKGPTPHGGEYAEIYFLNAEHDMVDETAATEFIIIEFDETGREIVTTRGKMDGR